jgi:VWFA-related protein
MNRWDISFGLISNQRNDWFVLRTGDEERSVIKDLGRLDWHQKFKIPIIEPLPAMGPGEHRMVMINTSGDDSASKSAGGLPLDIRGAPSSRDHGLEFPTGDLDLGSEPPPVRTVWPPDSKKSKQSKSDPVFAKVLQGHMYALHLVDSRSDYYVLIHVDALMPGDSCTFSWRRVTTQAAGVSGPGTRVQATPGSHSFAIWKPQPLPAQSTPLQIDPSVRPTDEKPLMPGSGTSARDVLEKPRLKVFGSSLDQLRWDPVKQAAVEKSDPNATNETPAPEDTVRVETRLVVANVLVLDEKGHAVEGLRRDDFMVTEDERPQEIAHFSLGDDQDVGRSIVLLFDYSGSIRPFIQMSAEAAKSLVDQLGPKDRMAIVTDDVELLVDFTHDKGLLKRALAALADRTIFGKAGKSAQFSALLATLRELFDNEDMRPIIIFQTDGDQAAFMQPVDPRTAEIAMGRENIVQFGLADVNAAIERSRRATIYTVIPGLRLVGLPADEQARRQALMFEKSELADYQRLLRTQPNMPPFQPPSLSANSMRTMLSRRLQMNQAAADVAALSGGKTFYLEQPEKAGDIYSQILSDVNRRYVLGYYPNNKTTSEKRRKVVITVRDHPEYTVEGRKSYIATPAPWISSGH